MTAPALPRLFFQALPTLAVLALLTPAVTAQTAESSDTGTGTDTGPIVTNSSVGYVDSAIPADQVRLRSDNAYGSNRPSRAEFIYARGVPGPGLPLPEPRVDFQDLAAYVEKTFGTRFSGFVELPVRFLNPQVNGNAAGLGDLNTGLKYALFADRATMATFQFRTYVPSGNARHGLGTNHVSLEPALLVYRQLAERWRLESEFRYWVPAGGTDFAGDVIRYGTGLSYGQHRPDRLWLAPVAEVVGWTVLGGKQQAVPAPGPLFAIQDATGDTIVNVKLGLRLGLGDRGSLYAGYGRPLTGEVWYENVWRVEFRLLF